jgi:hypothetical protein
VPSHLATPRLVLTIVRSKRSNLVTLPPPWTFRPCDFSKRQTISNIHMDRIFLHSPGLRPKQDRGHRELSRLLTSLRSSTPSARLIVLAKHNDLGSECHQVRTFGSEFSLGLNGGLTKHEGTGNLLTSPGL